MTPKKSPPPKTSKTASSGAEPGASLLRAEAEARLSENQSEIFAGSELDARRQLHELQVHQIELEMINDELVRTRAELEESQARYFNLFDLAPVGILTLNEEGLIQETNLTAASQLGLTRDKLVNRELEALILKEDRDLFYLNRRELFESGNPQECEMRMHCTNGSMVWVQAKSSLSEGENGIRQCQVILSNITRNKQSEQELVESEQRLQNVLQNSPDIIYSFDIPTRSTIFFSRDDLFGFSKQELETPGSIMAFVHPDDLPGTRQSWNQVLNGEDLEPIEFRLFDKSGDTIWLRQRITVISNDMDGKPKQILVTMTDITERKKAKISLAESEERFRLMIENAPLGYQSLDIDGNFIHVNPAWLEMIGYESEEVIGHWFGDFLVPGYQDAFRERFPVFKAAGQIYSEFEMLHKNGSTIFVAFEGRVGYDAAGEFKQTHCMLQDITEKSRAEEKLRRSESELKKAQSYAHVGSWIWDISSGKLEWSDEMYNIFGISKENFSGNLQEVVANAIHPDDRQKVEASNSSVANAGKPIPLEYRILRPDGSQRMVWGEAGELEKDAEGKPALLRGIVMDITERKQAEGEIRRMAQMLDIAPNSITVHDFDGRFLFANQMTFDLHGYTRAEFMGLNLHHIDLPESEELIAKRMQDIMERGDATFEVSHYHKDGSILPMEVQARLTSWDDHKVLLSIATDIRERKQAEEELRHRAEVLDGLQKTVLDITAAQTLPGLLESIVERACQLVGASGGGLYLTDPQKKEVRCVVSYNTHVNYAGVTIKFGEGVSGRVAQTGQPFLIDDYMNWAGRAQSFAVGKPFSTVLGVPLLWGGQVNGVIDVFHYEDGKTFTQADMDLLSIFAGHAAIAIENSRLLEASQAGEALVRALSTRLAEAEENERRRIARELHDQVGQSLSALSINMNIMHSQVPEFLPGFKRRLDDSLMLIDQTTDHIRHLMSELRPSVLDDYGLKAALDWAVGSIAKRTNLKLLVEGECNRFPPRIEIALFRIAQEALVNISRHAHARNVKILLTQDGAEMSMSVTDDGIGFDPSSVAATEKSGWGLRLMAERAESIGASLQVESTPGKGTCITVRYHDDNSTGG